MKKLMIILLLGSSLLSFGQKEAKQKKAYEDFSTEQQAILQTKKMALELDLNDNQQKQLLDLNKKWAEVKAKKRAEMKSLNKEEMSSTDRFNHMNTMLDEKLAHQNELKKILDEDQYGNVTVKIYNDEIKDYELRVLREGQYSNKPYLMDFD